MAKCPKCQYFSFDSGDRCRNCGYDFSLTLDLPADDLEIQSGTEPIGPLGDFSLNDTPNLPLFTPSDPDAPLVTPGAAPRAPLAVRRGAPTTGRAARPKPRADADPEPRLALDTAEIPIVAPRPRAPAPASPAAPAIEAEAVGGVVVAGTAARLGGAAIDLAILGGIDLMVLYFTLKICDLTFADVLLLPAAAGVSAATDGGVLAVHRRGRSDDRQMAPASASALDRRRPSPARDVRPAIVRAAAHLSLAPLGLGSCRLFDANAAGCDRLADTASTRDSPRRLPRHGRIAATFRWRLNVGVAAGLVVYLRSWTLALVEWPSSPRRSRWAAARASVHPVPS
jgi:hypothetical protein